MIRLLLLFILLPFIGISQIYKGNTKVSLYGSTGVITSNGIVIGDSVPTPPASYDIVLGEEKAFPSAFGFGAPAGVGQPTRTIYTVTNTNISGAGSIYDAVSAPNRDIVFDVGGTMEINGFLNITQPNIRIHGQTAPGSGFQIHGDGLEIHYGADHTVIRHLAVRPGDPSAGENQDGFRIFTGTTGQDINYVMADNLSVSWGTDEVMAIGARLDGTNEVRNVTIQNSIISESFNAKGLLLYGENNNISILYNYFAHNSERNIRSSTLYPTYEFNNNVIFGSTRRHQPNYGNEFDMIGNVYKTRTGYALNNETLRLENNNCGGAGQPACPPASDTRGFVSDNLEDGSAITISTTMQGEVEGARLHSSGSYEISSANIVAIVLEHAGKINRDALDQHVLDDYTNDTGALHTSEATTTGLPTYSNGTKPADTDGDLIPDAWETSMELDINNAADASIKPEGFTLYGVSFDNREYTGGTWNDGIYTGGTLTGNNIYTWLDIYLDDLGEGFQFLIDMKNANQ